MMHLSVYISGLLLLSFFNSAFAIDNPKPADWPMFGQNLSNTANNPTEAQISVKNASSLKKKWTFTTGGDVSARAAVVNNKVYFPDWGGNLWAVNALNGKLIWGRKLSDYGLPANTRSRTSPAVVDGVIYIGTQEGAYLLAINAATGSLIWKTQLESPENDPYAINTTSPAVINGTVYTGVASLAEGGTVYGIDISSTTPRGSIVAVNAATGAIQWRTYTVPVGYSGGGVWGSNPVIDVNRNTVFVGTGNNYAPPQDNAESSNPSLTYGNCIRAGGTAASCNSPNNFVDAILALDMTNGAVKWAKPLVTWNQSGVTDGSDDWNVDCFYGFPQCPSNPGPDYDFGSAPNLISYQTSNGPKTILGAGQKSGIYYALDPDTGNELWHTQVGPGSALGGMEWGSATDGKRIYVAIANFYGLPSPEGGNAGSWAALDPETGDILWQTADPNGDIDTGPVTVANGVVFAGSMAGSATAPNMFALDARNGNILWSYAAGSSVNAGATIVKGKVYWGSGFARLGIPGQTGNNQFYAFSINGM
jgi:polyvinyl alcohol dehydrogenase (cytochrome)